MLQNYIQKQHTHIVFGTDILGGVGADVAAYSSRCLLHFDSSPFLKHIVDRVRQSLQAAGVSVFELGGVQPNPQLSLALEGAALVREQEIGFILSVGGGSAADSGKFIGLAAHYDGDPFDYVSFAPVTTPIVPNGCVITAPGTSAETSLAIVIRNDLVEPEVKKLYYCPPARPSFAYMDPTWSYSLPPLQTACGAFDAISHCMECYFTDTEDADYLWGLAEAAINSLMKNVRVALREPENYAARANLCQMAYLPMETQALGTRSNWCMHNVEKPVTATYHSTHGLVLGIITPYWMEYVYQQNIPLFTRFCVNCLGAKMDFDHPERTILEGIQHMKDFVREIGLKNHLSEIGVKADRFEYLADLAVFGDREKGYVGQVTKLYFDDIVNIYRMAL